MLLLHQDAQTGSQFLVQGLQVAGSFGIVPIVLTVARSERKARLQQQRAREIAAAYGLKCDFDFVVGLDACTAVASVARWRLCQVAVLDCEPETPWWRRLRSSTLERLSSLPVSFSVLAFAGPADLSHDPIADGRDSRKSRLKINSLPP
jgi:hypothetical protein